MSEYTALFSKQKSETLLDTIPVAISARQFNNHISIKIRSCNLDDETEYYIEIEINEAIEIFQDLKSIIDKTLG